MEEFELTILMPCLNEAETIAQCIRKAKQFLENEKVHGEILVADNGSTDGSQQIAVNHGARLVSAQTRGYGAALQAGIESAKGRFIIMGDADDSYDFFNLLPFLQKLREGFDLVMGNRFKGGIVKNAMPFLNRYLGNPVLSLIGRLFFKSNIGDFHCGLRAFHRERFLQLNLHGDGMEFASEMIIKATLKKFKITEVPTQLFPDGRSRPPHLRPWRDGWRHLRLLLLFSPRWLFFYPGLFLIFFGLTLMLLLLRGPILLGPLSLDIHTMLFASLFALVGLQVLFFSVFANFIAGLHLYNKLLNQFQLFTLERGLFLGFALLFMGTLGASYGFWYWQHLSFGPLLPTKMMRILIPSMTCFIYGLQVIFSSFFLSILHLHFADRKTHGT